MGGRTAWAAQAGSEAVYGIDGNGREIARFDFTSGSRTVVNTDAVQRRRLEGLAVRDDVSLTHLIAVDQRRREVLFYQGAAGVGRAIGREVPAPAGVSLDGSGNIYLVSRATHPAPGRSGRRSTVWSIPRGGPRPGGYGTPLPVDTDVPAIRLEETRLSPRGALIVLASIPPAVFRYPKTETGFGPREVFLPSSAFPSGARPRGLGFTPQGELLVSLADGTVLRYDAAGVRVLPNFASGLGGLGKLSVGIQDGLNRVFVGTGDGIRRFGILEDGGGDPAGSVSAPLGVLAPALASGTAAASPAGTDVLVVPAREIELTFDDVALAGLTSARVLPFPDNRGGAVPQPLRDFFPGDPDLQAQLPNVTVPAYAQGWPKAMPGDPPGGPYSGPSTFVLAILDTTAQFDRTVEVHVQEAEHLGHQPSCSDPDATQQPRTFYVPEIDPPKSEPPIVEGALFADFSTGCGSNIGRGSRFSLWLTGRDTRAPSLIVAAKLDSLDAALAVYAPLINSATLATLTTKASNARTAFEALDGATAVSELGSLIATIDAAPGSFTPSPANVAGELIARAASLSFMIPKAFVPDAVPPSVVATLPGPGALNVATNSVVVVRFDEVVRPPSAGGSVRLFQGATEISGSVTPSPDGFSLVFTPSATLAPNTLHTIQVTGILDLAFNAMPGTFTSSFTTGATTDTSGPTVVRTSPVSGATGVPLNAAFTVQFGEPIDPTSITAANFTIQDNVTYQYLAGAVEVDASGTRASFVPAARYGVNRYHAVQLLPGVRDLAGNATTSYAYYGFTTGYAADTTPPTLAGSSPAQGDTGIPTNAPISLAFSEPLDPSTLAGSVSVDVGGSPVAGSLALSNGNTRLTFSATASLVPAALHSVTVGGGLADLAGHPLANPGTFTFTAASGPDTTAPSILAVDPASGAAGVATNPAVRVRFSEAVNPQTVTSSSFLLYDNVLGRYLDAVVTVATDRRSATLAPSASLAPFRSYYAYVNAFADLAGQVGYFNWGFTTGGGVDSASPVVTSVSPLDGAASVARNAVVSVRVSEPLSTLSVGNAAIQVSAGGPPLAGNLALSADRMGIAFTPSAPLAAGTSHTVTVAGFTDVAGNPVVGFGSSFTTGAGVDTTAPSLISVIPPNASANVPVAASVFFTFDEPVDPATLAAQVYVYATGANVAGTLAVVGTQATFTPSTPMPGNTLMGVYLATGFTDYAGNVGAGSYSTFMTVATPDTTPPSVALVTPADGATGVSPRTSVTLTFSESLDPSTVNAYALALFAGGYEVGASIYRSADNRTVTLVAGGLPAQSLITIVATNAIHDLSGNPLGDFVAQFSTGPADSDSSRPSVVGQRPGNGALGVPAGARLVLYVDESLDAATLPGALHVSADGVLVAGSLSVTDAARVLEFVPASPWPKGALVQLFLDSADDLAGNPLYPYQGSFRVAPDTSLTPPVVVRTNPIPYATAVPTNAVVDVEFNEALNPASVTASTARLLDSSFLPVAASVSLTGGGRVVRIVPSAPLLGSPTYYYIDMGTGIADLDGQSLAAEYNVYFDTGSGPDALAPSVVSVSPPDNAASVGVNASIRVRFSEGVDPLTVSATSVMVSGGAQSVVPSSISFTGGNSEVLIVPQAPLAASALHTVTVSGVEDVAGNPVTPLTTHFTTASGPDTGSPAVVRQAPANGATDVPIGAIVSADFDEPLDPSTVNAASVQLLDQVTNLVVPATVALAADGRSLTLTPTLPLAVGRYHYVQISGCGDLAGNGLPYSSWAFTTGYAPDTTPPQVVDVSPPDLLAGVPTNAEIVVVFDEPIRAESADGATVRLSGAPLSVTRILSNGNRRLTLRPGAPLSAFTTYSVELASIRDVAGNVGGTTTTAFTTGSGADLVAPVVLETDPASGAKSVATNPVARVRFSERVDPQTVNNASFLLYDGVSGRYLDGVVAVSADRASASFTPSSPLEPFTPHYAYVNGFTDLAGQAGYFSFSFTTGAGPDSASPTVVSVSPPDAFVGVPLNVSISVRLDEPLSALSVTNGAVQVSSGGGPAAGSVTLSADRKGLKFAPSAPLGAATAYTVAVSNFTDVSGNPVTPFGSSFTTGGGPDTTAPSVLATTPPNLATNVDVSSVVVVTFDEAVDPATVGLQLSVYSTGAVLAGSLVVSGGQATFTPATPMPGGTQMYASLAGGFRDLAGNPGFGSFWSFTTAATPDTTPPTVSMVTPSDGAAGVSPRTAVTLTFSESVNPASVAYTSIALFAGGSELGSSYYLSADNRTLTVVPSGLLPQASVVTVTATSGVQDLSGNPLPDFRSQFTTGSADLDVRRPSVVGQRPGNGALGVATGSSIVLYLDEALTAVTVPGAFHASVDGVLVSGTTSVTYAGRVVEFVPALPWAKGALVQVFLDAGAEDPTGNSVYPYQGSFRVVPDTSLTPPLVVRMSPTPYVSGVPTNAVVEVEFNEALNAATVNGSTARLLELGTTPVPAVVSLTGAGRVVRIVPIGTLLTGSYYYVEIGAGVEDLDGQAQAAVYNPYFYAGAGPDSLAPSVVSVTPPDNATLVGVNATIRVKFSEAIDPIRLDGTTVVVTDGVQTVVPSSISFGSGNAEAIIVPQEPLNPSMLYSITVSGVEDVAGNAVLPVTTHFTTAAGPDTTAPAVKAVSVLSGALNVPPNAVFSVEIDEAIDPASVDASGFFLYDNGTGLYVAASRSVSPDGQTLSLAPDAPLLPGHYYRLYAYPPIRDLAGNPLYYYVYFFVSYGGPDTTPPQVVSVSPADGLTAVPINAPVSIDFDEPLQSLGLAGVELKVGGAAVAVVRSLSAGNQKLTLRPILPLTEATTYDVTIAGVKDVAGNILSGSVGSSFTSGNSVDLVPLSITSVSPPQGASGVPTNSVVVIQFSERANPQTVSSSNFRLWTGGCYGTPVLGTLEIAPDSLSATLTPAGSLPGLTGFCVTVSGIADLVGQTSSFSSSFTTGP